MFLFIVNLLGLIYVIILQSECNLQYSHQSQITIIAFVIFAKHSNLRGNIRVVVAFLLLWKQ